VWVQHIFAPPRFGAYPPARDGEYAPLPLDCSSALAPAFSLAACYGSRLGLTGFWGGLRNRSLGVLSTFAVCWFKPCRMSLRAPSLVTSLRLAVKGACVLTDSGGSVSGM